MNVAIVLVTHNRLEYTRKTLPRLLEDPNEQFDLYLWDNASTDATAEYLKDGIKDPRIVEVVLSRENVGQTGAMNEVWSRTKAELVGKLDNDCLVTPGWTRIFAQAHRDIESLGSIACWNFPREIFDEAVAARKIQAFNSHKIFRHPWTCGSGFILKRKSFLEQGFWSKGALTGTTGYFLKLARAGFINGWYYPLVLQEHMDDPSSQHSRFHRLYFTDAYRDSFGFQARKIHKMQNYMKTRSHIIHNLLYDPYEPDYYDPWRIKFRRLLNKLKMG